jgi:hypothetical protein
MHCNKFDARKQKDRLARRSFRNPIRCFDSGSSDSNRFPLPAPTKQAHRTEAGGEESESGGDGGEDWGRVGWSYGHTNFLAWCTPPTVIVPLSGIKVSARNDELFAARINAITIAATATIRTERHMTILALTPRKTVQRQYPAPSALNLLCPSKGR